MQPKNNNNNKKLIFTQILKWNEKPPGQQLIVEVYGEQKVRVLNALNPALKHVKFQVNALVSVEKFL